MKTKTNTGVAQNIWPQIKQAYLVSDIIEIKTFLIHHLKLSKHQPLHGGFKKETKGWRKEKEGLAIRAAEKVIEKTIENPDVQLRVNKLIKTYELIQDSVSYAIMRRQHVVNIGGENRTVLDIKLSDMKDMRIAAEILAPSLPSLVESPLTPANIIINYIKPNASKY